MTPLTNRKSPLNPNEKYWPPSELPPVSSEPQPSLITGLNLLSTPSYSPLMHKRPELWLRLRRQRLRRRLRRLPLRRRLRRLPPLGRIAMLARWWDREKAVPIRVHLKNFRFFPMAVGISCSPQRVLASTSTVGITALLQPSKALVCGGLIESVIDRSIVTSANFYLAWVAKTIEQPKLRVEIVALGTGQRDTDPSGEWVDWGIIDHRSVPPLQQQD